LEKPDDLTTLSRSDDIVYIYQSICILAPSSGGQFIPANDGQGHWLFHHIVRKKQIIKLNDKSLDAKKRSKYFILLSFCANFMKNLLWISC